MTEEGTTPDLTEAIVNSPADSTKGARNYGQRLQEECQRYTGLTREGTSGPSEYQSSIGNREESHELACSSTPQQVWDYHALNERLIQAGIVPKQRVAYLQLFMLNLAFRSRPQEIVARAQRDPMFRKKFQSALRLDEILQRELTMVGIGRLTPLRSIDPATMPHNI